MTRTCYQGAACELESKVQYDSVACSFYWRPIRPAVLNLRINRLFLGTCAAGCPCV